VDWGVAVDGRDSEAESGGAALRSTGRGRARGDGGVGQLGAGLGHTRWRSEMVRHRMGGARGDGCGGEAEWNEQEIFF
jgi:hypothetical protein